MSKQGKEGQNGHFEKSLNDNMPKLQIVSSSLKREDQKREGKTRKRIQ